MRQSGTQGCVSVDEAGRWKTTAELAAGGGGPRPAGVRLPTLHPRPIRSLGDRLAPCSQKEFPMAKAMTKSEIAATLAEKVGITKKQVSAFFAAQAELAYKQAKNQFVVPG